MGMFDWVYAEKSDIKSTLPNESTFQSKDGPCLLGLYHRDALNDDGSYMFNSYRGDSDRFKRGPDGWVKAE